MCSYTFPLFRLTWTSQGMLPEHPELSSNKHV